MSRDLDFEGMKLVFRRSAALPQLPGSAHRLLSAIDSGEASATDLERIITCDPSLTGNLLRLANSAESGLPGGITTVRGAILRLGQRTVRSMCVSLSVQNLLSKDERSPSFDPMRYARHSVGVGFLARYIFARRKQRGEFETKWMPEEFFAAGLTHDIGHALLSRVAPNNHAAISSSAEANAKSFSEEFEATYGGSLGELGAIAAETWGLPTCFHSTIRYCEHPFETEEESVAVYCLNYANYLAGKMGLGIERWDFASSLDPMVESEVGLKEQEVESLLQIVSGQTEVYLAHSGCLAA
jgi:HD-like signal output (HDOD) protein